MKQAALLASPIYIGQAQGEEGKKTYKKRSQNWAGGWAGASLLFASFGSTHPHTLRIYFPLLSK